MSFHARLTGSGLVLLALLGAPVARAQAPASAGATAPPLTVRGISRDEAVRMGAARGPGVAVAGAPRGAARDAHEHATSLPRPPVVSVSGGYRAGSLTPGVELGVTVLQDLSVHGLGAARTRVADALGATVEADLERARLEGASRAVLAHVGLLEANEVLRLRTQALAQAEAILKTTRARVAAGVGMPFELAMAQGDVGAAHAAMLDAEGMRVEAIAELRFALGMDATADIDATGDLYASDERPVEAAAAVRVAETSHPAIALARARAELAKEDVQLSYATLSPAVGVGGSYVREGTGDHVVTAILSFPLPVTNPAAYEASRQRAAEQTAAAQIERTHAEVMRDVRIALHDREHWREVREALRAEALTPMKEALRLSRVQYEVGTQDISTVLLARQRLVSTEEQLARVAAEVLRADVRVQYATGTLLERRAPALTPQAGTP